MPLSLLVSHQRSCGCAPRRAPRKTTRLACWETPSGRPGRCGGVPCEKHAVLLTMLWVYDENRSSGGRRSGKSVCKTLEISKPPKNDCCAASVASRSREHAQRWQNMYGGGFSNGQSAGPRRSDSRMDGGPGPGGGARAGRRMGAGPATWSSRRRPRGRRPTRMARRLRAGGPRRRRHQPSDGTSVHVPPGTTTARQHARRKPTHALALVGVRAGVVAPPPMLVPAVPESPAAAADAGRGPCALGASRRPLDRPPPAAPAALQKAKAIAAAAASAARRRPEAARRPRLRSFSSSGSRARKAAPASAPSRNCSEDGGPAFKYRTVCPSSPRMGREKPGPGKTSSFLRD